MELRVREIRKSRGITQTWLAKESGVSLRVLNRLEREHTDTRVSVLLALARALQVEPGELLPQPDQPDQD